MSFAAVGRPDESVAVMVLALIDVENSWYDAMSEKTLNMVAGEYGRTLVVLRWRWAGPPPRSEAVIAGRLRRLDFAVCKTYIIRAFVFMELILYTSHRMPLLFDSRDHGYMYM